MDAEPQCSDRKWLGWWSIWAMTFVVSLAPPLIHYFRRVPEILEPFRYAWGLMPADLIFLRELGEMSQWIPLALVGGLVFAIRKPTARRSVIAFGACLSAGFSAVYASYCLLILTTYFPSYSNAMEGRTDLLQAFYARQSKAEQAVPPNRSEAPSLNSKSSARGSED